MFGISTMAAAGIGNAISDVAGMDADAASDDAAAGSEARVSNIGSAVAGEDVPSKLGEWHFEGCGCSSCCTKPFLAAIGK